VAMLTESSLIHLAINGRVIVFLRVCRAIICRVVMFVRDCRIAVLAID